MLEINDLQKPIKFLVGMNGSGKTYALNEALKEHKNDAFLITEDGNPIIPKDTNRVTIDYSKMVYIYSDERSRGKTHNVLEEEIVEARIQNVLLYCNDIKGKLDLFKNKSKGQEKLYNMMNIFTDYNLNHIKIIYFDEPENFLDEEFLKVIGEFFALLNESGIVVRVATHNSRLLNILSVNIEDIIFLNGHSMFNITNNQVKEIYNQTSLSVEKVRRENGINVDAGIKYKLEISNYVHAFNSFIEQNLKSEEFYRCLFYREIVIVEGISEIVALNSIKNQFEDSIEIFNPNGKAFIPFFVELFLTLKKDVTVIIDDDLNENEEPLGHAVAITYHLKHMEDCGNIKLVEHSPDLEQFYGIDLEQVADMFNMSRQVKRNSRGLLKSLAAFIFFSNDENKIRLKDHILDRSEPDFEFE